MTPPPVSSGSRVSGRRRLSSALLILWLAGGCATTLPPPRTSVREDAQHAVDLLRARWKEFTDFRAQADVLVTHGGRKQQAPGVLLLKAPGSLRFEVLSPFGPPLLIATVHDGQIVAYNAASRTATVGAATPDTAARLFWLAIEPEDLVGLLAGLPVPPKDLRVAEIQPADEHGRSLEMIGTLHRQRVWMDFATGVVRRVQISGGRLEALLDYERTDDGALTGFALSAAQENVTGTVRYRDVTLNGGIDNERFGLILPRGTSIEQLR
jgi:outer membrane lipoprotein-sorting protein